MGATEALLCNMSPVAEASEQTLTNTCGMNVTECLMMFNCRPVTPPDGCIFGAKLFTQTNDDLLPTM